ncbi:hypothetical protein BH11BAC7_BH11BAC7_01110 [soil metagenome]
MELSQNFKEFVQLLNANKVEDKIDLKNLPD